MKWKGVYHIHRDFFCNKKITDSKIESEQNAKFVYINLAYSIMIGLYNFL